jgi:DNA modification methylase
MGEHRLLCGDATSADDAQAVLGSQKPEIMVTDPPYGIDYDPNWREEAAKAGKLKFGATSLGVVANDDRVDWTTALGLFLGDIAYVWHAAIYAGEVLDHLAKVGMFTRAQIVWTKQAFVISRGHYNWQHETCWYAVRKGKTAGWVGGHSESTVWQIDSVNLSHVKADDAVTFHGTQKPVECMARPMRNHRVKSVYDPFLGSGTTLIAAEQLGRRCYALEIEPSYCDIAVTRWEEFTGQTAQKES